MKMHPRQTLSSLFLSALLVGSAAALTAAEPTTIFDLRFTENNQRLPENLRWFRTHGTDISFPGPGNPSVGFQEPGGNNNREVLAYFPATFIPVGFTLRLDFATSIQNANNRGNGWRIGLFSTNGARRVHDNYFPDENLFDRYTGYILASNPRSSSENATKLAYRSPTKGGLLIASSASREAMPPLHNSIGSSFGTAGTVVTGYLAITNLGIGNGVRIEYLVPGRGPEHVQSFETTDPAYLSFDTFAFHMWSDAGDRVDFHSLALRLIP